MMTKILVSSCLLGTNCKYNGKNNLSADLVQLLKKYEIVSVCPESLGGLPTPRVPSERVNNQVINKEGVDVTMNFNQGAQQTLKIAKEKNCKIAILKKNSPSCGYGTIYDGTFTNTLMDGDGVTAELLYKNGLVILNEDNFKDYFK